MKVLSIPDYENVNDKNQTESGVRTVVNNYYRHAEKYDIEFISDHKAPRDLVAAHAGITGGECDVAHLHGIYFTGDYPSTEWQHIANKDIVNAVRHAKTVTVPSNWVQEIFQRDMRFSPVVLPHGVDWDEWQHEESTETYILGYAKNRAAQDVCDPTYLSSLARKFSNITFKSTFYPDGAPNNIKVTGVIPYDEMKVLTQRSAVFVQAVKETFGLHALEAAAAGVPVVAYNHGGVPDFVQHGVNGYLAEPGNIDDLANGLAYCMQYRNKLGANGRELARAWTWERVVHKLSAIYRQAMEVQPPLTAVIIPCYNKQSTLERAVKSALDQYRPPERIVIVDDGSTDASGEIGRRLADKFEKVEYHYQNNSGVAVARNFGISLCDGYKYICCLDSDDAIAPEFLDTCLSALESDPSLHIAYTKLLQVAHDGKTKVSNWPDTWNFDQQLTKPNQVPTCCVFRKDTFDRLGGYRKRYAPIGCGSEDAALWTAFGLHGYKAALVTEKPLFLYSVGTGITAQKGYSEVDWRALYPSVHDGKHPLGSYATPANGIAHSVHMYDEPIISVVIPVGPGHAEKVQDALDSVESQRNFRKWEIIVVNDTGEPIPDDMIFAYPFVKWLDTTGKRGPGHARNLGARIARARFLVFLDADDLLMPDFMSSVLMAWDATQSIVYTDYLGSAVISEEEAEKQSNIGKMRSWGGVDGLSVIGYPSREPKFDYSCELAQSMPRFPLYHWCLVTCLIPKAWHDEIGGFDEDMASWEDVDYHWRMAWAGKCYVRVRRELILYRFTSGTRRASASTDTPEGIQLGKKLLRYIDKKKENITMSPCSGCSGNKAPRVAPQPTTAVQSAPQRAPQPANDEFDMYFYEHPNRGGHRLIGASVFQYPVPGVKNIKASGGGFRIDYGYHSGGEPKPFLVHSEDVRLQPGVFRRAKLIREAPPVERPQPTEPEPVEVPQIKDTFTQPTPANVDPLATFAKPSAKHDELHAPPPPIANDDGIENMPFGIEDVPFDPQTIMGVTANIAKQLEGKTLDDLKAMTKDDWMSIHGVADARSETIMDYLANME